MKLSGLYVITDEKLTPYKNNQILEKVRRALKGGARIVQLRDKNNSDEFLIPYAKALKELSHKYGAIFIINDRVELALKVDADGVHLGEEDVFIDDARKILKDKIIGISCYGDLKRAKEMELKGANYVAFGSFFSSPTKPSAKIIDKKILSEAKKILKIPICAIGGITLDKAEELIGLSADMIAVISDIWKAENIEERARKYKELFERYGKI
ncbi:MAG: thiamine phosphate synthase [Thermodesulfobacterium geofontis]|uniref:Thiamine-phosphate synthase n=1 Tax=Thermodesulfobacterium geofontis TaxID=1295609 RepID=A0A2N7PQ50_9BACT|nr:MAG: thiamine phosphate synthase [Thermodesulfobacterium geofontis]